MTTDKKPNPKQQECIDNIDGSYLVLAGPGTGKTFTIIERIKAMILNGIDPHRILCLTFTDDAANEMIKRLEKDLETEDLDINVRTYHGFCCQILEEYPEEFNLPGKFWVITTTIARILLKECIDDINSTFDEKNNMYHSIKTIYEQIDSIKINRLTKKQYFYNLENNPMWIPDLEKKKKEAEIKETETVKSDLEKIEKNIKKAKELWQIYELYSQKMKKRHYIDFNDMILFVLDKFEQDPSFLKEIADKYDYLLVDEYQDTNKPQNEIIFNLARSLKKKNIFVVGDDDQIIFSFQGARLDTMERFLREFPDTKVICLQENMRSTQCILDAARKVILQDKMRLENNPDFSKYNIQKKLTAVNEKVIKKTKPVRCYKYADSYQEYYEIVNEIKNLIDSDECPVDEKTKDKKLSEIAVLAKTHAQLNEFAEIFKQYGIPYEQKEGKNIFHIPAVITMYYYMQILVHPELYAEKILRLLLLKPFDIHPMDYTKIYENKSKNSSLIDTIKEINDWKEPEKIKNFLKIYDYLSDYKNKENVRNTILEIGYRTGIFKYYTDETEMNNWVENVSGLRKLVDEASSFSEIYKTCLFEEFENYIDILVNDDVEIQTDKAPIVYNAVQLSTYHASKGREFEYVYMPTLIAKVWESNSEPLRPSIPLDPKEYKTDDELKEMKISDMNKQLYVGMTRAKHTLRLSYIEKRNKAKEKLTKFVAPLLDSCEKESEPFEYSQESFFALSKKALEKRDYDYRQEFDSLIKQKVEDKSFSATDLNVYLDCPRQYFYKNILEFEGKYTNNKNSLHFGNAVHKSCEYAVNEAQKNGQYPSKDDFIGVFKDEIDNLCFATFSEKEKIKEKGIAVLDKFYQVLTKTPVSYLCLAEEKIKFEDEGYQFSLKIDRIDKNDDGTYVIYDYKTGKPKTKKGICIGGKYENYYNQIAFYKYYYEKFLNFSISQVGFIFPEEPDKNLYLKLSSEDCDNVVRKYKKAIDSIKNLEFEPIEEKNDQKKPCKYCPFKIFCDMEVV